MRGVDEIGGETGYRRLNTDEKQATWPQHWGRNRHTSAAPDIHTVLQIC